jgi:hypothetical protein
MSQTAGETDALRKFRPMPDLDSVVFIRKQNRDFVAGRGPLSTSVPSGARRFMRIGMWFLFIAGIIVCLVAGAMEFFQHQQRAALEASLRTVDAQVVGCENRANEVPYFTYTVDGKAYKHYARQTRADMCDKRSWQVTYIDGNPDAWAVAPDSPLKPFEDNVDAIWIVGGPGLLFLAAVYWLFSWYQTRRAGQEARLTKEGTLIGAELLSIKWSGGGENSLPSLRVKYRMILPDGRAVEGKQSDTHFDLDRRALPPAGSKLLVLRVDDSLQQVL